MYQGTKIFKHKGQEETFVRFTMKKDGTVENINQLKRDIVKAMRLNSSTYPESLNTSP